MPPLELEPEAVSFLALLTITKVGRCVALTANRDKPICTWKNGRRPAGLVADQVAHAS